MANDGMYTGDIDSFINGLIENALGRARTYYKKKNTSLPVECELYVKGYFESLKKRLNDLSINSVFLSEDDTLFLRVYFGIDESNLQLDLNRFKSVGVKFSTMVLEDVHSKIRQAMSLYKSGKLNAFLEYPVGVGELGLSPEAYSYLRAKGINLITDFSNKSRNVIFIIPGISEQEANQIIDLIHSYGVFFSDDIDYFIEQLNKLAGIIPELIGAVSDGVTITGSEMNKLISQVDPLYKALKMVILNSQDSRKHRK